MSTQIAEIVPQQQTALASTHATSIESSIAVAVKARVEAATQARYTLAMHRPRDPDRVRQLIMKECDRPAFAEVARYRKPQGKKWNKETRQMEEVFVEGPSVRFVETAIRCYGNVMPEEHVIYDDANCRIIDVTITDLESNLTYQADVIVTKEIERSSGDGRTVLSQRQNSYDKTVYTVVPTEDEMLTRQNALISKMRRNVGLRLLSRDLVDEAMERVVAVQQAKDKTDPEAGRNKLFDQFGKLGITAVEIKEYLGHEVGWEDLATLRAIGQGIVTRETTWRELVAEKKSAEASDAPETTLLDKLKAKAAEKPKAKSDLAPQPPAPTPPDLMPYEAGLAEAGDRAQLEAARERYASAVPLGTPGRERLDKIYIRRQGELKLPPTASAAVGGLE